jgi:hypothetical protein
MNYPIVLLSQLFGAVGNVQGRKKIQKMVYLLQAFGAARTFRFRFELYGPYSCDLQDKLEFYLENGLLRSTSEQLGEIGTSRLEATHKLSELLAKAPGTVPPAPWAELARDLNQRPTRDLEAISSLVFLQEAGKVGVALRQLFCDLKPEFGEEFDRYLQASEALWSRETATTAESARV